jgi:hypothetical protein
LFWACPVASFSLSSFDYYYTTQHKGLKKQQSGEQKAGKTFVITLHVHRVAFFAFLFSHRRLLLLLLVAIV